MTVELTREFLAEHSSELLEIIEGKGGLRGMSGLWAELQDATPTAEVRYLGEEEPDSYDIEDLIDPPTPQAIQNLLQHGAERIEDYSDTFYVDLEVVDQFLESSSVGTLEAPSTDAIAERARVARQLVARSRQLAEAAEPERIAPVVLPPPPPVRAPAATPRAASVSPSPVPPAAAVAARSLPVFVQPEPSEEWSIGTGAVAPVTPSRPERRPVSASVAYLAALGLGLTAAWSALTGIAIPVVAALVVGALAIVAVAARR